LNKLDFLSLELANDLTLDKCLTQMTGESSETSCFPLHSHFQIEEQASLYNLFEMDNYLLLKPLQDAETLTDI